MRNIDGCGEKRKVFRHFKRKQNEMGEGSREWLLCLVHGSRGGAEIRVRRRQKKGRERRRDGRARISVQWLQGCVES